MEPFQLKPDEIHLFIIEKVSALESLDEGKIRSFCEKWGMEMPLEADTFWVGVHVARALDFNVSRDKRGDSALWLSKKKIDLKDYID